MGRSAKQSPCHDPRKIRREGECRVWTGAVNGGSPQARVGGKKTQVRRLLYEEAHGPIPDGRIVKASCDTRLCIALDHLTLAPRGSTRTKAEPDLDQKVADLAAGLSELEHKVAVLEALLAARPRAAVRRA